MKIHLSKNEHLGGIFIKSNSVKGKELFFRVRQDMEKALGETLSYQGYHPFDLEPLSYKVGDTVRGDSIEDIKELLQDIRDLEIII